MGGGGGRGRGAERASQGNERAWERVGVRGVECDARSISGRAGHGAWRRRRGGCCWRCERVGRVAATEVVRFVGVGDWVVDVSRSWRTADAGV